MPVSKCPICRKWFGHQHYDEDVVHNCRDANGDIKTEWKQRFHPARTLTKFDDGHWPQLMRNVPQPKKKLSKSRLRRESRENLPVDTFVQVSGKR